MPQSLQRKRIIVQQYPLGNRDDLESRIIACAENIHTPYSWYREDVRRLMIVCDMLYTENQKLKAEMEEKNV